MSGEMDNHDIGSFFLCEGEHHDTGSFCQRESILVQEACGGMKQSIMVLKTMAV